MEKIRLIIDTDAGVDDAHAILMALTHPNVSISGITTLSGNVSEDQVTRNVCLLLDLMERDIPIFRGAKIPLLSVLELSTSLMGEDGFGNYSSELPPTKRKVGDEYAALALIRMAKEAAKLGPFTLVALGPLTNIALAVRLDPEFASIVPRLVIMGGTNAAKGNASAVAEFNFYNDPEAAAIVFLAGFANLWVVPWECAVDNLLLWPQFDALSNMETLQSDIFKNIMAYFSGTLKDVYKFPGMPLPDQLAMALVLDENLVTESHFVPVSIETAGKLSRGLMAIDWYFKGLHAPNAHVVTKMDFDRVLELIKDAMSA
jgi:purine nucleosidase